MYIKEERVKERFRSINNIGKNEKNGIQRLALTAEDKQVRDWFVMWLKSLELEVRIDDFGNIFGRKEGEQPTLPPIVLGSHLDSVPNGGMYDGVLGVLAGLEVIETLREHNIIHSYPIEVAMFTNEEGARFPTPMLGSAAMTEALKKDHVYDMKDDSGNAFIDELKKINYLGKKENRLNDVTLFAELHIEQGPILEEKKKQVGIVKGIQGLSWHHVTFFGQSDHAATTPMHNRKDALISAVKVMNSLNQWASLQGNRTLVTFGKCSVKPNVGNVIPNECSFSIDIRHHDHNQLLRAIDHIKGIIQEVSIEEGTRCLIEDLSFQQPVHFTGGFDAKLKHLCQENGISYELMFSGAGHDAMYMSRLGDTIMVFVPSINGKSHCTEEYSQWPDVVTSIDLLYQLVVSLINSKDILE
ncbi:M20 family metallo-hydrolase [Anaerobacillus sp. MEB173]|uniref:M20 family metallo-hydrolase n=1 Tax=Anaerobacillus sp. MEB173 TaxID=3383345 RepID=UPI003F8DAAF4